MTEATTTVTVARSSGSARRSVPVLLISMLYIVIILIDPIRKITGLPNSAEGVIYLITILIYLRLYISREQVLNRPRYLPAVLAFLTAWCVLTAFVDQIPAGTAILGWSSYVFFVPLFYVGRDLMGDDQLAGRVLTACVVTGSVVAVGAIIGFAVGSAAPRFLQPLVPAAGYHSFDTSSIYLAPSLFANAEEASEQLLLAFFAWLALMQMSARPLRNKLATILGAVIAGGMIATARRTELVVAIGGVLCLIVVSSLAPFQGSDDQHSAERSAKVRLWASLAVIIIGSGALAVFLGAFRLLPFLTSGSPPERLSLMLSRPGSMLLAGQGPGTSTQALNVVGANSLYSANTQGLYREYVLNGRTFATVEGGFTKTWVELGLIGVVSYGCVFASALLPVTRRLGRLDPVGRALLILAFALGVIFLKGHQSLDDPLIQPLFWICTGATWARICGRRPRRTIRPTHRGDLPSPRARRHRVG